MMKTFFVALLLVGVLLGLSGVAEAGTPQPLGNTGGGFTYDKLIKVANNLVQFILRVAGFVVVGVIVYYGIRMVIAGNDAAKYAAARKGLNWALIGALVIFGVYTIIATIQGAVESLGS
jgi:hypothetical protein